MSSIGEGIDFSQEQQRISGNVPSSRVSGVVVLCTKRRCWLLRAELFNLLWLPEGGGRLWRSWEQSLAYQYNAGDRYQRCKFNAPPGRSI